jgi:glyoxylase-like metal-dependent hydrolase (beta-lactamase superfamily II)
MYMRAICLCLIGCSGLQKSNEDVLSYESETGTSVVQQVGDTSARSYLLRSDKNELILIDTGGESQNRVIEYLASEGVQPEEVQKIFLTHGHGNHIGGISYFPNAKIYALEEERPLLLEKGIVLEDSFDDGEIISLGSSELEVFKVAGHSHGNVAYRFEDILIMGDSAISLEDGSIAPITANASDPQQAHESLISLATRISERELSISYMLFSHSESLVGIDALLAYQ